MGKVNKLILSLGSNFNSEENIQRAIEQLRVLFDPICFSEPVYTDPIGDYPKDRHFLNQVAVAYTAVDTWEEIMRSLKQIEYSLGRRDTDKVGGLIPIDIDLLKWNEEVLKPADMEREYILSAICFLERKYNERSQE